MSYRCISVDFTSTFCTSGPIMMFKHSCEYYDIAVIGGACTWHSGQSLSKSAYVSQGNVHRSDVA